MEHKLRIEHDGPAACYRCEAPPLHNFYGDIHEIVWTYEPDEPGDRGRTHADAKAELIHMARNVEVCRIPDCEWCADVRAGL